MGEGVRVAVARRDEAAPFDVRMGHAPAVGSAELARVRPHCPPLARLAVVARGCAAPERLDVDGVAHLILPRFLRFLAFRLASYSAVAACIASSSRITGMESVAARRVPRSPHRPALQKPKCL